VKNPSKNFVLTTTAPNYFEDTKSSLIHIDLDPVGEWGCPIDPSNSQKFI
jgi:hypothetical protein